MKRLSVVIPVYNEKKTISTIIKRSQGVFLPEIEKEIIVVDDGSTDGTADEIRKFDSQIKMHFFKKNRGKGSAIRQGFNMATGDYIIIQDADLEYDPEDYVSILGPLKDDLADVVFGSRFVSDRPHRVLLFWHSVGNKFLTAMSNMFTNLNLTDMEVGYKAFNKFALNKIKGELKSERFSIEPEITARVARHKLRLYEVGISYRGRTYSEGKKINWKDGFSAIWAIIKFNLF